MSTAFCSASTFTNWSVLFIEGARVFVWVDLDNDEALARLQRRLRVAGVDDALRAAGCNDGDTVRIGEAEFVFTDEESP